MFTRLKRRSATLLFLLLGACGIVTRCTTPEPVDDTTFNALYETPLEAPDEPLKVYHLGHSLVGQDMPGDACASWRATGTTSNSQLGWGSFMRRTLGAGMSRSTDLRKSNAHPQHRDPHEALAMGTYDAAGA